MRICNKIDCDVIKIANEEIYKQIFVDMNILPINEYFSTALKKNVYVYIAAKKLKEYFKNKGVDEIYE